MTFKPKDYQLEAYKHLLEMSDMIDNKDGTVTATGRIRPTESERALEKLVLFGERYSTHRVHDSLHCVPLEMNFADLEKRMIATDGIYNGNLPRKFVTGNTTGSTFEFLYGGSYYLPTSIAADIDFTPPPKDFSKARTKKEKLDARLKHENKNKPSGLLAKLMKK